MQNHRAPFNAIDSYLNQNRVNYVDMIPRTSIQQPQQTPPNNSGNNDHRDIHTRRSNVFTPPGANWISRKKSVESSPAPNRVLPQPQSMNNIPYQATVAMLPTPPPMNNNSSMRLPTTTSMTNTNNSMATVHPLHHRGYLNEGRKQAMDQNLESFQFPPLSAHWSSSSSFHEDNTDREHWRHSEENGVQHVGRYEASSSPHHILSGNDRTDSDRRDNHFTPTDIPNNNHNHSNNNKLNDNNNWWKRQNSDQHQNQEQQQQQPQYHQQDRQHHQHSSIAFRNNYGETSNNTKQVSNSKQADRPKRKRSKNAFFIFSEERREQIRAQQPRIRNSDLNRLLGKEWKELSEENKSHYKHRAEILKEQEKQYSEPKQQQYSPSNGYHNSNEHDIMRSLLVSSSSPSSASSPPLPYYSNSPTRRIKHYHHYHQEHSASPSQFTTNGHNDYSAASHQHNESRNNTMFTTPRHLSIGSERSHDALFVSANNTDWHSPSNSGSKNNDDDEDDSIVQVRYEENNEVIEDIHTSDESSSSSSSSSSSPLNGTATTSNNSRNVVSVASHSGAAEAEALAGLTASMQRNEALKRLAYKRHGEKPKRVKRPPNAYLLFNRDVRHKILDGNPNLTVSEISKEISERWNALSEEGKAYYNQEAARLKQRHMDDNPNFIYTRRSKAELEEAGYRSRPSKRRKTDDTITTTATAATIDVPHQQHLQKSRNVSNNKQNGAVKERDPRGRKKKRLKNPTAPKHPMSGFLFYSIAIRSKIVEHMPKATVGEISKVIAEHWRKLDEKDRSPFIQRAKEDKERYAREMESFTATMIEGLDEAMADGSSGSHHHHHHHRQGNMSPVELDSDTIATVAQMVNPRGEHLLPPLSSSSSPRQYQVLPATPRNDD